jgi:hypothetical protein
VSATRFIIDDRAESTREPRTSAAAASHLAHWLSWTELLLLMSSRLLGAFGWLIVPLLLVAIVPVVLLGTLMLIQAPIFFVLWRAFGGESLGDAHAD